MSFSLYVHIPYCFTKCPYCDFNAYAAKSWPEERYIEALCKEFSESSNRAPWKGQRVDSVYFGGGTPSLFRPASLHRLLAVVYDSCSPVAGHDVSLEVDPASVFTGLLEDYRGIGVSRLSFGIQSFQASILTTLGRLHDAETASRGIEFARAAGFKNINVDLIYGVPGQTLRLVQQDLRTTVEHGPEHVSIYGLTYEKNTPFYTWRDRGVLSPISEDAEAEMYECIHDSFRASGYQHYEISNFCRPGFPSRHNVGYWQGKSYLGIGAGSHSYASTPGWGWRRSNLTNPTQYMDAVFSGRSPAQMRETLTKDQARTEYMFLTLRQSAGITLKKFSLRFGAELLETYPHTSNYVKRGLIEVDDGTLRLTRQGVLLADNIFASFA